jgi:hypothetical protein
MAMDPASANPAPPMTLSGWVTCTVIIPAFAACISLLLAIRLFPYQPHVIWPFIGCGTLLTLLIPVVARYWLRTMSALLAFTVYVSGGALTFYFLVFMVWPWWADNGVHWWATAGH